MRARIYNLQIGETRWTRKEKAPPGRATGAKRPISLPSVVELSTSPALLPSPAPPDPLPEEKQAPSERIARHFYATPSGMPILVRRRRQGVALNTGKNQPKDGTGNRMFSFTMPMPVAQTLLGMLVEEKAALSRYVRGLIMADLERRGRIRPAAGATGQGRGAKEKGPKG